MRASKYCTTYQTCEQKGSFQGINTCDVTNFGNFDFKSTLLEESESMTIKYRLDINSVLNEL